MNPDENINVVAVFPDGTAKFYGHTDAYGIRPLLRTERYKTYGDAVLAADEYETKAREERARKAR